MYINEIEKGTKVRILYKDLILETTVKAVRKERSCFAMLEQIQFEDGILSFHSREVTLEYDIPTGGVIRFKADKVGNIVFNEEPYLIFVCNEDTKMYNRRSEYRSEFCADAEIQLGNNTKIFDGFIHDVSRSGINVKIRLADKPKVVVGTKVSITFYYEKFDRNFRLKGTIVRTYTDPVFVFCGISLIDPPPVWLSLVNVTERRSLEIRARIKVDDKKQKNNVE